jgi:hypothetical protein
MVIKAAKLKKILLLSGSKGHPAPLTLRPTVVYV